MMHLCVADTYAGVAYAVIGALSVQNKVRIAHQYQSDLLVVVVVLLAGC